MFDQLDPGAGNTPRNAAPRGLTPRRRGAADARPARPVQAADTARHADLTAAVDAADKAVRAAGEVTVEGVDPGTLASALSGVQRIEGALTVLKGRLIAAYDDTRIGSDDGACDTAAVLEEGLRLSGREARRQRRRAQGLTVLPETERALADGSLTAEHADHITRAANRGRLGTPAETEQALLEAATTKSPDQLRDHIKRCEQAADDTTLVTDENTAYQLRYASMRRKPDGMWRFSAEFDPVSGERVATALDALCRPDPPQTPKGQRRTPGQQRADALVDMADIALQHGEPPQNGGIKPHVSVLVREQALADLDDGTPGEAAWSGPISPEATRRLTCDATVVRVARRGTSMQLDVGRRTPVWNVSQRIAVVTRDGHCRWPGCDRPAPWCVIHHVRWYSEGGRTDVANGVLLCRYHHRKVHEGGWKLAMDRTHFEVTVTSPDRAVTRTSQPQGAALRAPPRQPG